MARTLNFQDPRRQNQYVQFRLMLDTYKTNRGCIRCGYKAHPAALELDHRVPALKARALALMYSYSPERIKEELDKCDVLCSNCHRIKTYETGQYGPRDEVPEWTLFDYLEEPQ